MLLVTLVLQASVALAAALAGAFGFRRRSAALRHFLLASGVIVALAAAALPRVAPAWEISMPAASVLTAPVASSEAPFAGSSAASSSAVVASSAPAAGETTTSSTASRVSWMPWLAIVWLAGTGFVTARLLAGLAGLRRVAARAGRVRDERLLGALRDVTAELRITRAVTLLFDEAPIGTWGAWRPRIVLPPEAGGWSDERLRAVLAHELAHVQRFDWPVQLAAEAVCAALWFNPLAWVVARRLREEGERACDDIVLGTGLIDRDYATHLFDIARAARGPVLTAAMPMARPSSLEGRIAAMLNPTLDRRAPSRVFRFVAAALLLMAVSVAAVRVTAQQAGPGPLQGVVYDSSGAVLPGVEMALVNEQGVKWSTPTDGTGRFEFAPVGAGKYVLEAVVPGFRTFRQDVVLEREKDWNKNITLQVGELQETIQVTARRPTRPAPPPASAGVVRVGGNIKQPAKVFNVAPVYPTSMQAAGLEGVVKLDVLIATDGTVASVRVASAQVHPAFAAAAMTAVKQWKFTPTLLNGQPVEVEMTASIAFNLTD
jgi:TonB family protein